MHHILRTVPNTLPADTDHPFLRDPYAPMFTECVADTASMKVIGEIPRDLHGIYVRNTHNPVHESLGIYHPYDGDGMLHAMHFEDGRATYRNRFVETTGFLAEMAAGRALWPGILAPELHARRDGREDALRPGRGGVLRVRRGQRHGGCGRSGRSADEMTSVHGGLWNGHAFILETAARRNTGKSARLPYGGTAQDGRRPRAEHRARARLRRRA